MNKLLQKRLYCVLSVLALALLITLLPASQTQAATKVTHNYSGADYILAKGKSVTIKNSYVVKWSSDNSKIATVNQQGKVVAKSGGVAVITGTTSYGGKYTYEVGVKTSTFIPASRTRYKAGKDIASGTYVVIHDKKVDSTDSFTYWAIYTKKNGGKLLTNDGFSYTSIVTVKKGQCLELSGGYAVPLKKASRSLFTVTNLNKNITAYARGAAAKVGYGLPAGTYKFTLAKKSSYGTINICKRAKSGSYSYTTDVIDYASLSKSSKKSVTVTLKKGQYIYYQGCTLKKVK